MSRQTLESAGPFLISDTSPSAISRRRLREGRERCDAQRPN